LRVAARDWRPHTAPDILPVAYPRSRTAHLADFTPAGADSLVFVGPKKRATATEQLLSHIAAAMDQLVDAELSESDSPSGTQRAREPEIAS